MYFFDSTTDDKRIYQAADWARFHNQIIGNGVSNTPNLPDLEVTARTNMNVALGAGYMFANGYMYQNDSTMTLSHSIADPNNNRIDRVVICFDNNPMERRIYAYIKKGVPANNPTPPNLQRDNYVYEMSVAQVTIIAGKSYVEQTEIRDERANDNVCGYIPLHNIYRGMDINEYGMVTMPNQSYVEMNDSSDLTLNGESSSTYISNKIPIIPLIDRQNEISSGIFNVKADGDYLFYFHLALSTSNGLQTNQKIEIYLVINNNTSIDERVYLFNRPGFGFSDYHFIGSGVKSLSKGDKVQVIIATRNTGDINSRYRRMSIAKIS